MSWIVSHFSNRIAGYIVLVPIMPAISIIVRYLSHSQKATTEMINDVLLALPSLLIFGLISIGLIEQDSSPS